MDRLKSFAAHLDPFFLKKVFIFCALCLLVLVPCEALAVYWLPPSVKKSAAFDPSSLSFIQGAADPSAYRQAVGSSRLFGDAASFSNESLLAGSLEQGAQTLVLKGIVVIGTKDAIFFDRETQQTHIAAEGDKVKDLVVKKILEDTVLLSDGRNEREMKIETV